MSNSLHDASNAPMLLAAQVVKGGGCLAQKAAVIVDDLIEHDKEDAAGDRSEREGVEVASLQGGAHQIDGQGSQ